MIRANNVVGQFGLKSAKKKREVMNCKILKDFSWNFQDFSENWCYENLVNTMLCSELDFFYWKAF